MSNYWNSNTTNSTTTMGSAFRQVASQPNKVPGLKGENGSAVYAPRTQDCLFEVDAILRATTSQDAINRVDKALLFCEELPPEEGAEKLSHLLVSLLAKRRVRGGEGMKKHFFTLFVHLYETQPTLREYLLKIVPYLPHLGCFKDYWQILKVINEREQEAYTTKKLQLQHFQTFNELVKTIVSSYWAQIRKDQEMIEKNQDNISLAGKWSVSEKCSFGKRTYWYLPLYKSNPEETKPKGLHRRTLYHYLTIYRWQPEFINGITSDDIPNLSPSSNRKRTRQEFSALQAFLDVPEVKMSSHRYAEINHEKVSAICRLKHMDAFKNEKKPKYGPKEERFPYDTDRIKCAENFYEFMNSGKLTQGAMDLISIYQKIKNSYDHNDIKTYEEMFKGVILTTGKDIVRFYVQLREKTQLAPAQTAQTTQSAQSAPQPEEFFNELHNLNFEKDDREPIMNHRFLQTTEELDNFYLFLKKNHTNTTQIDTVKRIIRLFARGVIPVMDVSGSMTCRATNSASCMDVCVSLGLLFTFLNPGDYEDLAISFTDCPMLFDFQNMTFKQRINKVFQHVGYNTNVKRMMREYLNIAQRHNIPEDQLADIVIFSDGGFDSMIGGSEGMWTTSVESFESMFRKCGYEKMPQIYFCNLHACKTTFQAHPERKGVSQVNGYNPAMFQQIMTGDVPLPANTQNPEESQTKTQKSTEDDYLAKVQDKFFDLYRFLMTETKTGLLQHYTFEAENSNEFEIIEATNDMFKVRDSNNNTNTNPRPSSAPPTLDDKPVENTVKPEEKQTTSFWNMMGF